MSQRFPVRKLFALSWAVYRQNGYELVRASRRSTASSSAKQLRQMIHRSQAERGMVNEDWQHADEMINLINGLGIKALERSLSSLEKTMAQITSDDYTEINSTVVNAVAAVPEMLQSQKMNDRWYQIESSLTNSAYIGDPNNFDLVTLRVKPEFCQRVKNGRWSRSLFVAGVTPDGNVVKFYLYDSANTETVEIGKEIIINGQVKRHSINDRGIRETFMRQVHVLETDDLPW